MFDDNHVSVFAFLATLCSFHLRMKLPVKNGNFFFLDLLGLSVIYDFFFFFGRLSPELSPDSSASLDFSELYNMVELIGL